MAGKEIINPIIHNFGDIMLTKEKRDITLIAVGVIAIFTVLAINDNNNLKKLPPKEKEATLLYRRNEETINRNMDSASTSVYFARMDLGSGKIKLANDNIRRAKELLEEGEKACPGESTVAGKECADRFVPLRSELDALSANINETQRK